MQLVSTSIQRHACPRSAQLIIYCRCAQVGQVSRKLIGWSSGVWSVQDTVIRQPKGVREPIRFECKRCFGVVIAKLRMCKGKHRILRVIKERCIHVGSTSASFVILRCCSTVNIAEWMSTSLPLGHRIGISRLQFEQVSLAAKASDFLLNDSSSNPLSITWSHCRILRNLGDHYFRYLCPLWCKCYSLLKGKRQVVLKLGAQLNSGHRPK